MQLHFHVVLWSLFFYDQSLREVFLVVIYLAGQVNEMCLCGKQELREAFQGLLVLPFGPKGFEVLWDGQNEGEGWIHLELEVLCHLEFYSERTLNMAFVISPMHYECSLKVFVKGFHQVWGAFGMRNGPGDVEESESGTCGMVSSTPGQE